MISALSNVGMPASPVPGSSLLAFTWSPLVGFVVIIIGEESCVLPIVAYLLLRSPVSFKAEFAELGHLPCKYKLIEMQP